MNNFERLLQYVRANYPEYAYVVKPGIELAVDGLVFRPRANGQFSFLTENGDQEVTLDEALQLLKEDFSASSE